jgi:hypothetical protein
MSASFQHAAPSLSRKGTVTSSSVLRVMMSIQDRPKVPAVVPILPRSGDGDSPAFYRSRDRGNGSGDWIIPRKY